MSYIESLFFGFIQGFAEFLPISSSGHLVIAQSLLNMKDPAAADLFFDMLLHLGTLVAVFFVFYKTIFELVIEFFKMAANIFTGKFRISQVSPPQKMILCILVSIIPLFAVLPFMDTIQRLYSSLLVVGIALIVNSIILFLSDKVLSGKKTAGTMNFKNALAVGITQCVAIIPGISRSGSTITAGIFCGLSREYAATYSFILSIPTILGGTLLSFIDVVQSDAGINSSLLPVYATGFFTAMISGFFAIKLLQFLLKSRKFIIFSVYSLIVGIVVIILNFII